MPQKDPSKTEKPTAKRRKKAREDGNVPKSGELPKAITLLVALIALQFLILPVGARILEVYRRFMNEWFFMDLNPTSLPTIFTWVMREVSWMIFPFLFTLAFAAFMTMRLQVGSMWSTKVFSPKFGKIFNIFGGITKIFTGLDSFVRMGRSLLQGATVAIAAYVVIKRQIPHLIPLFDQTPTGIVVALLETSALMIKYALIPMIIVGLIDLWWQRYEYEEKLKMSKDEIKDEQKQAEGDPKVKMEMRQKMMALMAKRMMSEVPNADVVITNPTHIAVALAYEPIKNPAPMVLAKGAGQVAEKIKEIAAENNIPIREDKPLARALYKQVEIGEMIPEELYQAVAAILSKLNNFKRKYRNQAA